MWWNWACRLYSSEKEISCNHVTRVRCLSADDWRWLGLIWSWHFVKYLSCSCIAMHTLSTNHIYHLHCLPSAHKVSFIRCWQHQVPQHSLSINITARPPLTQPKMPKPPRPPYTNPTSQTIFTPSPDRPGCKQQ